MQLVAGLSERLCVKFLIFVQANYSGSVDMFC